MPADFDEKAVYLRARELTPLEREAYLRAVCPDDAAYRAVQTLLEMNDRPAFEVISTTAPTVADSDARLERLGDYQLIRKIGEGGMGVVYLAQDVGLRKQVAIKFLSSGLAGSEKAVGSFIDEAQKTASLNHPAIVQVFKLQREAGRTFIVSEYIDGPTLAMVMQQEQANRRDKASTQRLKDWIRQSAEITAVIADALDCAHRSGIVHCDVKPSNVLMDPLRGPRLADFGIARYLTADATSHTAARLTPWYASPELASIADTRIDQRSDVFSLGVVLYELLSLHRPFDGESIAAVLEAVRRFEPPKLRTFSRTIHPDLQTICQKAMEKQPERRYQSAAHFAADLRSYLRGDPILAKPPPLRRRAIRWVAKRKRMTAASVFAVAVTLISVLFMLLQRRADANRWFVRFDPNGHSYTLLVQRRPPSPEGRQGGTAPNKPRSLQLEPTAFLSRALTEPVILKLDDAIYRATIVSTDGAAFAEVDLVLTTKGPTGIVTVRMLQPGEKFEAKSGVTYAVLQTSAAYGDMALVESQPDGFTVGNKPEDPLVQRRATVQVPSFYIDRHEVSNAEYLEFLRQTAANQAESQRLESIVKGVDLDIPGMPQPADHHPNTPDFWKTDGYRHASVSDWDRRPVVGVRRQDAAAYAQWKGKRLPDMYEWEAAARETGMQDYPNNFTPERIRELAAPCEYLRYDQARDTATRMRAYEDLSVAVDAEDPWATRSGIRWLFGNVREITSTVDIDNTDGVAKGRCWLDEPAYAPFGVVWTFPINERYFDRGFRCARSAAAVARLTQ